MRGATYGLVVSGMCFCRLLVSYGGPGDRRGVSLYILILFSKADRLNIMLLIGQGDLGNASKGDQSQSKLHY